MHPNARHFACLIPFGAQVGDKRLGRAEPFEHNAFFFSICHFTLGARHVRPVTAVKTFHADSTLTDRSAHTVHGRVAPTNDHHALAFGVQPAVVKFGNFVSKAFTVGCCQVINCLFDPRCSVTGNLQIARLVNASGDDHGIMCLADFQKPRCIHVAVGFENHTTLLQLFHPAHNHVFLQLKAGNAVGQQPTGPVIAVINGDLDTRPTQNIRRSQPTRPGTNDANRFGAFLSRSKGRDPAFFPGSVGDVLFHRPDGHGAMARLFNHAVALAQAVLGADAATNFGEGIGRLTGFIGLAQPAFGSQTEPVRNIVMKRAVRLTIGHATLTAAAGLLGGFR